MSRRRTTKKLYQANAKSAARDADAPVTRATAVDTEAPVTRGTALDTEATTSPSAAVSAEALERLLALEASEREVSEQRTTDLVGRYFKLTLAMVCLNMVVAGANVALLFRRPAEIRTVVTAPAPVLPPPVAQAPVAAPAPIAPPPTALPSVPAAADAVATEKIPLLGAPSKTPLLGSPAKTPLLGKVAPTKRAPRAPKAPVSADPDAEASGWGSAPEPVRAVGSPSRAASVLTAKLADSSDESRMTERW
jgi:hypothetical protein